MLTKNDIKLIGDLLEQKLEEKELKSEEKIDSKFKTELTPIREDIAKIRKDMKTIINFFGSEYLDLRTRIEKIEEVLKLNPIN